MSVSAQLTATKKRKAVALLNQNRLPEARAAYQDLLRRNSKDAEACLMLGIVEGRGGDLAAAEKSMRNALTTDPELADAWFGFGQIMEKQGHSEDAGKAYLKAVTVDPRLAEAHAALGQWALDRSLFRQAMHHFAQAVELGIRRPELMLEKRFARPKLIRAYAKALFKGGEPRMALEVYQSLLDKHPDDPDLLRRIGETHVQLSQLDQAKDSIRKGLELAPGHLQLRLIEIELLRLERKYHEAIEKIRPLFDSAVNDIYVALTFARLCHHIGAEDAAIARLETLMQGGGLNSREQAWASFELGRLHDAAGDYDRAFAWFRRGNELMKGSYDRDAADAVTAATIDGYSREHLAQAGRAGNRDRRPVFIVGMLRSGTSLVEQILASHPDVHGAGELSDIRDLLQEYRINQSIHDVPQIRTECRSLTTDALDEMASRYLGHISEISDGERYVTDKMPSNCFRLGLISLMLPGARIIHCRRDPLDTCLSCYFQLFGNFHPYSNDLEDLACYYRNYRRLMAHWRQVLELPILDIDYQALVADQEAETRRMLDFLELAWDDRCLRFFESERPTLTASSEQVNKPVYSSSVGRWRHYEKHIAPLIAELGAAAGVPGE